MTAADLKVSGAFDEAFADWAMPVLEKLAQQARDVTVDMSEASGGDPAGLRALVYLHKKLEPCGCRVRVLNASARVHDLFARYHLADIFIEGAAGQANTALRSCFFGIRPQARIPAIAAALSKAEAEPSLHKNAGCPMRAGEAAARTIRDSVGAWLDASTVAGRELRGGDALKSYRRWAKDSAPLVDSSEFRKTLAAILGAGRVVPRTSGYIIMGIGLRQPMKARLRKTAVSAAHKIPRAPIGAPAPFMLASG